MLSWYSCRLAHAIKKVWKGHLTLLLLLLGQGVEKAARGVAEPPCCRMHLTGLLPAANQAVHPARLAHAGEGVEKAARKVSQAYAQGLAWVLSYYCHGTAPVAVSLAVLLGIVVVDTLLANRGTVHVPRRCLHDSCCLPQFISVLRMHQDLSFASIRRDPVL